MAVGAHHLVTAHGDDRAPCAVHLDAGVAEPSAEALDREAAGLVDRLELEQLEAHVLERVRGAVHG
jgi:hypothetical protein